jgi:Tol biopolymer transport system component
MSEQDVLERSGSDASLPADMVRSALTHILASRCFGNAPSLSRFLSYVVDNTLNGKSDALKEYSIGVDVFDRGASFDPKTDTIVRVQARRLRSKLKEYYQTEGRNVAVLIELEKGGYVPRFRSHRVETSRVAMFPTAYDPRPTAAAADAPRDKVGSQAQLWQVVAAVAIVAISVVAVLRLRSAVPRPVTSAAEYVGLTDFTESATAPALSPDGKMVTFIRGGEPFLSHGQIYVKLLPNGTAVRLTNSSNRKFAPVFTPDGARVVYSEVSRTDLGTSWDTFAVPVLGGEPSLLLSNATGLVWIDDLHVMFSAFKDSGGHLGIVTARDTRADERDVYLPAHKRGMAHYSYLSPDRAAVLVIEMDSSGQFQSCRLVPFEGKTMGVPVGPAGHCLSAAWSPDGRWMYFGVEVAGHSHLWRQAYPRGAPEQITFGPTEEVGVAVAPDGRSLITAISLPHSAIWLHDGDADRQLTSDGLAYSPRWSRDHRRVYYMARPSPDSTTAELRSVDVSSGKTQILLSGMPEPVQEIGSSLPGFPAFDISDDERQVVYSSRGVDGAMHVFGAPLDRSVPPRELARAAAFPSFGRSDDVFFVDVASNTSLFTRLARDGTRTRIGDRTIFARGGLSPDGHWAATYSAASSQTTPSGTVILNIDTGQTKRICSGLCFLSWSDDGKFVYATVVDESAPEHTLVIPIRPGGLVPDVPESGLNVPANQRVVAGLKVIERGSVVPIGDGSTYVYVKMGRERNLYRVPLH